MDCKLNLYPKFHNHVILFVGLKTFYKQCLSFYNIITLCWNTRCIFVWFYLKISIISEPVWISLTVQLLLGTSRILFIFQVYLHPLRLPFIRHIIYRRNQQIKMFLLFKSLGSKYIFNNPAFFTFFTLSVCLSVSS